MSDSSDSSASSETSTSDEDFVPSDSDAESSSSRSSDDSDLTLVPEVYEYYPGFFTMRSSEDDEDDEFYSILSLPARATSFKFSQMPGPKPPLPSFDRWLQQALQRSPRSPPRRSADQWFESLDAARKQIGKPLPSRNMSLNYTIKPCELICLVTESLTARLFSINTGQYTSTSDDIIINVNLEGLQETLRSFADSGFPFLRDHLYTNAASLGPTFGQLNIVEKFIFSPCDQFTMPFILPMLTECHTRVANLNMLFKPGVETNDFPSHLPTMEVYFNKHCTLNSASFIDIGIHMLRFLSTALPSAPSLSSVWIKGTNQEGNGALAISSPEDALKVKQILSMKQLRHIDMSGFAFDEGLTESPFDGLRDSELTELSLHNLSLPKSIHSNLASAVTSCNNLSHFFLEASLSGVAMLELGRGWKDSNHLTELTLGSSNTFLDSGTLLTFFDNASFSQLFCLKLSLHNWTPTFDEVLTSFIMRNHSLESVEFSTAPDFDGPPIKSPRFVAAVDSPYSRLQRIHFTCLPDHSPTPHVAWSFVQQLRTIMDLNDYCRYCQLTFEKVHEGSVDLMDAVAAITEKHLYAILRRDNWEIQRLLREYKQ